MLNNAKDFTAPVLTGQIATGVVVSNSDPLHLGRVKVRIAELHPQNLEDQYLPWVESWQFRSSVNGQGSINVPDVGSKCRVMFPSDDMYSGVYISGVPNVSQELLEDYPNTYGFIDRSGSLICANTNKDTYTLYHVSGTKLTIDGKGNCILQATGTGSGESLSDSQLNIQVVGNAKIQVQDTLDVSATEINISAEKINVNSGKYNNSSNGTTLQSGGAFNINAGSSLDLTGSPVLDGKSFGIHKDTCEGSTIDQFYAFSIAGSPSKGSAPKVSSPQLEAAPARTRQAYTENEGNN